MATRKKNNDTTGIDKRNLAKQTKGFECRLRVEDGVPKVAIVRDTEYGIDFIGQEGFDRCRAKSEEKFPSLSWHNITLPKGYTLENEKDPDIFTPTPQMINYLRALVKHKSKEDKALEEIGAAKKTLYGWRKQEGFEDFISSGYLKAVTSRLPLLLEKAIEAGESGNVQALKLLLEELRPKEVQETNKLTPVDFSGYLKAVRANDFELK